MLRGLLKTRSKDLNNLQRIIDPLNQFGAKFVSNKGKLPIIIYGTKKPKPIKYFENKGSAQCKSSVMLAALNTEGTSIIKAKKSRDHTELFFKYLNRSFFSYFFRNIIHCIIKDFKCSIFPSI